MGSYTRKKKAKIALFGNETRTSFLNFLSCLESIGHSCYWSTSLLEVEQFNASLGVSIPFLLSLDSKKDPIF